MATTQVMKNCKQCGQKTLHIQPSTSHVLHLLLSLITMGAWIIVWIIVALNNSTKDQCTQCGKNKGILG